MGQINLYKIDKGKKGDFMDKLVEKFEFLGEQNYRLVGEENTVYVVGTYFSMPEKKADPEWKWILDEYDFELIDATASPRAILVIEKADEMYALTYGLSYFMFCSAVGGQLSQDKLLRKEKWRAIPK